MHLLGDAKGRDAVLGLAHHFEALALEQAPCAVPEGRVVVDDEDGPGHSPRRCELKRSRVVQRARVTLVRPAGRSASRPFACARDLLLEPVRTLLREWMPYPP